MELGLGIAVPLTRNPIAPAVPGAAVDNLLLEDGGNLLLEDGSSVLMTE